MKPQLLVYIAIFRREFCIRSCLFEGIRFAEPYVHLGRYPIRLKATEKVTRIYPPSDLGHGFGHWSEYGDVYRRRADATASAAL